MYYEEELEHFIPLIFRHVKSDMYLVSDLGRIMNKNTRNILSESISEKGYSMSALMCIDGKQHTFKTHRIVAVAFLGDKSTCNMEIDHKDGNKRNNRIDNLEWVTHEENIRMANSRGLIPYKSGINMYNAKFSEKDIRFICSMLEHGLKDKLIIDICKRAHVELNSYNLDDIKRRTYRDITIDYVY